MVKKRNKWILIISTFFLLSSYLALSTSYETASVSRLVGNTPEDLINQLDTAEYNLNHASYYGQDPTWQGDTYEEKEDLLNYFFSNPYTTSNSLSVNSNLFQPNELLVIEADGTINNQRLKASGLTTLQTSSWKNDFAENSPIFVFDSDYAGSSIPHQDSYVRSLSRYSTIIAPTFLHSREFVRAFLCNLGDDKTLGNSFREARNRYYSFTSPDDDELLGITLMSYHLYGNPLAITTTPNYNITLMEEYCDQLIGEKEEPRRFGGQSTTKTATFTSSTRIEGNYELVELTQGSLRSISGELALPYTSILQDLPLNAIVTNISFSFSNPQQLVVNIPEFTGNSYQNRSCYEAQKDASLEPKIIYRPDKQTVRLIISPLAMTNCSEGEFTFYQTLEYAVDYISPSPIYFSKLQFPQKITPSTLFDLNAELRYVNNIPLLGDLELWADNQLLSQQEVNSSVTSLTMPLTSNSKEGYTSYALYYKQNNTIISSSEFTIETRSADIWIEVPELVSQNADVLLRVYNYESAPLTLSISDNLLWNNTRLTGQNKTQTFPPGLNDITYHYTSLEKAKQEYPLRFDLGYNNKKEVLHDIIITNHRPLIDATDQTIRAGEEVHLDVSASDKDGDAITLTVSEPVGNDLIWQTQESDAGNYTLQITASDGLSQDTRRISLKVLPNNLPVLEELNEINITAGEIVNLYLSASDADGDNLSYAINDSSFSRQGDQWFQWITAPSDSETRTITYSVSDGRATVSHNLIINIFADLCYNLNCTNSCQSYTSSENGTCVAGTCQYNTVINSTRCGWKEAECNFNLDCGINGWLNTSICQDGQVFDSYVSYLCTNPGISTASCQSSTELQPKQTCQTDENCTGGQCQPLSGCAYNRPNCESYETCSSLLNQCELNTNRCNNDTHCANNQYCNSEHECTLKTGCDYNNPSCSANQQCVNNNCEQIEVQQTGCQYNNPSCSANQDCINNQCQNRVGCQYNNPACIINEDCVNNVCQTRVGCTYNNPSCANNEDCINNVCQLKTGCDYNNPSCPTDQQCINNNCEPIEVQQTGCQYNNPPCAANEECINNNCQPRPGCSFNNPSCQSYERCFDNNCIQIPGLDPSRSFNNNKDLKAISLKRHPVVQNNLVTYEFIVKNTGGDVLRNIPWIIETFPAMEILASGTVAQLRSGNEMALYPAFPENCDFLVAVVDPNHTIPENDESNNGVYLEQPCIAQEKSASKSPSSIIKYPTSPLIIDVTVETKPKKESPPQIEPVVTVPEIKITPQKVPVKKVEPKSIAPEIKITPLKKEPVKAVEKEVVVPTPPKEPAKKTVIKITPKKKVKS